MPSPRVFSFNLSAPQHVRYAFEVTGAGAASGCLLAQRDTAEWARGAWPAGDDCERSATKALGAEWLGKGAWVVAFRTESCERPCALHAGHDAPSNVSAAFAVSSTGP